MKSLREIRDELVREGAKVRLLELNQERNVLLKIIEYDSQKKKAIRQYIVKKHKSSKKGFKYNGTHWTQKPENREKLLRMCRKGAKTKNG